MVVTIGFQKLDACVAYYFSYYFRAQGSTKDSATASRLNLAHHGHKRLIFD